MPLGFPLPLPCPGPQWNTYHKWARGSKFPGSLPTWFASPSLLLQISWARQVTTLSVTPQLSSNCLPCQLITDATWTFFSCVVWSENAGFFSFYHSPCPCSGLFSHVDLAEEPKCCRRLQSTFCCELPCQCAAAPTWDFWTKTSFWTHTFPYLQSSMKLFILVCFLK